MPYCVDTHGKSVPFLTNRGIVNLTEGVGRGKVEKEIGKRGERAS